MLTQTSLHAFDPYWTLHRDGILVRHSPLSFYYALLLVFIYGHWSVGLVAGWKPHALEHRINRGLFPVHDLYYQGLIDFPFGVYEPLILHTCRPLLFGPPTCQHLPLPVGVLRTVFNLMIFALSSEEVGHDVHLRCSHMTLVCTLCSYTFRRMQFARVAGSYVCMWTIAKSEAETEVNCVDLMFSQWKELIYYNKKYIS